MPASASWLDALPLDFYDQLARSLSLHGMAALELLSRPATPATNRLHILSGLQAVTVQRLNGIESHEQLLVALRQEPLAVYHLLLLGRLTLETSLAAPVLAYVQQSMGIDTEQLSTLLAYCLELSGAFLGQLEEHVAAPEGTVSLGLHRLGVEEAFAELVAELPTPALPAASRLTQLQMLPRWFIACPPPMPTTRFCGPWRRSPTCRPRPWSPSLPTWAGCRPRSRWPSPCPSWCSSTRECRSAGWCLYRM
jgi:hypothetical protein